VSTDLDTARALSHDVAREAQAKGLQVDPEALIEKLYTEDRLDPEERRALRVLLDVVRGSNAYAEANSTGANIIEAGMWGSVRITYRHHFFTPDSSAVTG
jgi:hypothetical protein